jgi:hypothetical protein
MMVLRYRVEILDGAQKCHAWFGPARCRSPRFSHRLVEAYLAFNKLVRIIEEGGRRRATKSGEVRRSTIAASAYQSPSTEGSALTSYSLFVNQRNV